MKHMVKPPPTQKEISEYVKEEVSECMNDLAKKRGRAISRREAENYLAFSRLFLTN